MPSSINRSVAHSAAESHPSSTVLAEFDSGRLDEAELERIEAHLDECPSCCEALAKLSQRHDRFVGELVSAAKSSDDVATTTGCDTPGQGNTTSSAVAAPQEPPRTIGRFRVRKQIGCGGFGVVLLAHDPQLRREVAVKIPRLGAFLTPELRERFLREAQAAAALDHPNIVPTHDAGEADGVCYIASAYCRGPSLSSWLKEQEEPVSFATAARLICGLAGAVGHAHTRGVLHRDLKPSNVLLEPVGSAGPRVEPGGHPGSTASSHGGLPFVPKVTDFGLAKLIGTGTDMTLSDVVMGTASYMSPEQASGKVKQVGAAADLYGLGSILYELLTGRPPFVGESELDTLQQVRTDEPVAPRRLRKRIPRDLETICLKCLAKEPRARYLTAEELAEDLQRYLAGQSIRARASSPAGKLWRWCRRNRAVAALSGCLLATLSLIAVGSTLMSIQLTREVRRREQAQQETKRSLFQAHLATARSSRMSPTSGRRFDALVAIKQATAIAEEQELGHDAFLSLRSEAIAAMALGDLQIQATWQTPALKLDLHKIAFDSALAQGALIDDDGGIVVQRCDDSQTRIRLRLPTGEADRLTLSDDGRLLAACDTQHDSTHVFIRDLTRVFDNGQASGAAAWTRVAAGHTVACFHFVPNTSRLAVVTANGDVLLSDGRSSSLTQAGSVDLAADGCVVHPDGVQLAVWGDRTLKVINLASGTVTQPEPPGEPEICTAAWSNDGRWLAVGDTYHRVRLLRSDGPPMQLSRHDGPVIAVAFSPDGTVLASTATDGTTRLWDIVSGRRPVSCRGAAIRFSQDGRHMLGLFGSAIARFQVASGSERERLSDGASHATWSVHFNSDGSLLAALGMGTMRLWDISSRRRIGTIDCELVRFWDSPSGLRLVVITQDQVQVYPLADNRGSGTKYVDTIGPGDAHSIPLPDVPGRPNWSSLSRTGQLAIATDLWSSFVIDLTKPNANAQMLKKNTGRIAISPNGQWLAAFGLDVRGVSVLSAETGEAVCELAGDSLVAFASFSPDGKWLVADRGTDVMFYEVGKWSLSHRTTRGLAEAPNPEQCFSFAVDGSMLMARSTTSQSYELVRVSDGSTITSFQQPIGPAHLSPTGSRIAFVNRDSTLDILDLDRIRRQLTEANLGSLAW